MSKEYTRFEGLFAYCRKVGLIPGDLQKLLIVDCDNLGAAVLTASSEFSFVTDKLKQNEKAVNLGDLIAKETGKAYDSAMIQEFFGIKSSLARYLKSKGSVNDTVKISGEDISAARICELCGECAESVKSLVCELYEDDVFVVMIGKNTALYPIEHAVRAVLSPFMPFGPIPNFIFNPAICAVEVNDAYSKGVTYIEENSNSNIELAHNISLQLVEYGAGGEKNRVVTLAQKGIKCFELNDLKQTQPVFALENEPITILADGKQYKFNLPRSLFKLGQVACVVRLALRFKNDQPVLEFVSESGAVADITLEKQVYMEDL